MDNIIQCSICRKPFQSLGRKVCPNCLGKMDDYFIQVRDYLDDNPNASIEKVSEETEISQRVIMYLIKEGRVIMKGEGKAFDDTLTCEICKIPIFEGRICETCKKNLAKAIDNTSSKKPAPASGSGSDNIKGSAKIR